MAFSLMRAYAITRGLRALSSRVAGTNSGDGKGLKGGAEGMEKWEFLIALQWVTLVAIVLIGLFAVLAGFGSSWARIVCTVLIVFPAAVVVFGAVDSGPKGMWGLVFVLPFAALVTLWWLPGTSRALKARKARRRTVPTATGGPMGSRTGR
jgi:hypothetical protein